MAGSRATAAGGRDSGPASSISIDSALVAGVAYEQFGVAWETTTQRYIPAGMLARVYAYDALGSMLAIPLGQTLAGPVALTWGLSNALLGAAGLTLIGALFMLSIRAVRTLPTTPASRLSSEDEVVAQPA